MLLVLAALLAGRLILTRTAARRGGAGPAEGSMHEQGRDIEHRRQMQAALARIEQKNQLIQKLLAGQITLLETAARFRALDRSSPSFYWDGFHQFIPGDTDEERHCREVIDWVETELGWTDPCLAVAICNQLEGELEERLRRGPLCLPP
jgi:hypothetical protein